MIEGWLTLANSFVKADQTTRFRWVNVTICKLHLDDYDNVSNNGDDGDEAIHGILWEIIHLFPMLHP